ncbi:branched-chain amino acid ABC transporter permease [Micromonospora cathayae]|uniref:Branched-chain amino acid ABC transporter permease n=1 Tax=Micromonospora cathayae TaxID=3028804 RepID=A0ABY7ZM06_9ACTN|nr:branched-chain amino acid ABC transporter permease [Micromonospora sp. HUAS 3]WDZ83791.1 branched-chain amino acid ABC transporter permease [Micromonospora sp. HUAS 3]
MIVFGEQLVNGIALGAIYAMFGVGFGLVFSTMGVFNIAFGMVASCGALIALTTVKAQPLPFVLVVMVGVLAAGAIGALVDQVTTQPLRKRGGGFLGPIITTIGALEILTVIASRATQGQVDRFPPGSYPAGLVRIGEFAIPTIQIVNIAVAALLVVGVYLFLNRARWGSAIRAVGHSAEGATLSGVASRSVFIATAFLASAISGLAAVLAGAATSNVSFLLGENLLLKGFAAVIIGGFTDIRGTALAGLVLGLAEVLGAQYVSGSFRDAFAFGLLILFLFVRPQGIFGGQELRV